MSAGPRGLLVRPGRDAGNSIPLRPRGPPLTRREPRAADFCVFVGARACTSLAPPDGSAVVPVVGIPGRYCELTPRNLEPLDLDFWQTVY